MIDKILTDAGVEHAQGRFIRMPAGTHAVYPGLAGHGW